MTGIQAMRFSAYLYVMPFLFVYTPILMPDGFSSKVLYSWLSSFISTFPFAAAVTGYFFGELHFASRVILFGAMFLLLHFGMMTNAIGLLLIAGVGIFQYMKRKQAREEKNVAQYSTGAANPEPK